MNNQKITKKYIRENLLTKDGELDGNKTRNVLKSNGDLYLIYNNIIQPKCKCGNPTSLINFKQGFREFCSTKCSRNNIKIISPNITVQYISDNLLRKDGNLNSNKTKHLKETNEELYCIFNNINRPKCECDQNTALINFRQGFRDFCSNKCSNNSMNTRKKSKNN